MSIPEVDPVEAMRLTNEYNLAGGMQAWLGSGLPVIKNDAVPGTVI